MDKKSIREIIIASSLYSIGSILGPLLIFGGFGFILDRIFDTKPWALLISVFVAFIVTNVLLFKKIKKINGMMDAYRLEVKDNNGEPNKEFVAKELNESKELADKELNFENKEPLN